MQHQAGFVIPSLAEIDGLSAFAVAALPRASKRAKDVSIAVYPGDDSADEADGLLLGPDDDKPKKKLGRKPANTEPANKRIAQNRQAQRLYRERKEQHVRDLEKQVEDLKAALDAAEGGNVTAILSENDNLKKEVAKLQEDNAFLRQMTFSFDLASIGGTVAAATVATPTSTVSSSISIVAAANETAAALLSAANVGASFGSDLFPSLPRPHYGNSPVESLTSFSAIAPNASSNASPVSNMLPQVDFASLLTFDGMSNQFLFDDHPNWMTGATSFPNASMSAMWQQAGADTGMSDSMHSNLNGVRMALKSVPSLRDKLQLVDELCDMFMELTKKGTQATRTNNPLPECPVEVYQTKATILECCKDSPQDAQKVLSTFEAAKEKGGAADFSVVSLIWSRARTSFIGEREHWWDFTYEHQGIANAFP
ncbi:hypothetical protein BC830DRAFT_1077503 [Chytriomyces sp. MP71]|nr:hypothetical protein BC830DRAFT_1077503 [Chytriomyces sp. MP71]